MRRLIVLATATTVALLGPVSASMQADASVYPGANGKIVFSQFLSEDFVDSFTINPDGSNLTEIGPAGTTYCGDNNEPWSPNGATVVCAEFDTQGGAHTATVDGDGSNYTVLSNPKLPADFVCGSWSPDGTRLLCPFTSDGVYTVKPNGTGLLQLTTTPAGEGPSGYANDGSHAYFTVQDQNDFRTLYSVRTDGTGGLTALSPPTVSAHDNGYFDGVSADSSPDGSRVVFAADVTGTQRALYVVNIDGTGLHQVKLPTGINPTSAQWSPDGNWIAFSGRPPTFNAYFEVYLIHPNGTGLKEITPHTGGCLGFAPIWSPDGTKLLFARQCYIGLTVTSTSLSKVNLDGTGLTKVADLNGLTSYGWGTAAG
jgi:Tol biopolymer transport system component